MIPNDIEERQKMIRYMLDGLSDKSDMTDWETNFIDNIIEQFSIKENLSDRQCEILEKIYDKY